MRTAFMATSSCVAGDAASGEREAWGLLCLGSGVGGRARAPHWLAQLAALQTRGAQARLHRPAAALNAGPLQVHVPTPFGDVVGVADPIAELRAFAAEFTHACHRSPFRLNSNYTGTGGAASMNPRIGDDTDDYCTRCHRLTNHTVAALVGERIAQSSCRTCGFQHVYKGGKAPQRASQVKSSAFDQVLAGILGERAGEPAKEAPRKRKRS